MVKLNIVLLTIPLRARRECFAPFWNKSTARPNSMNAVDAILEDGAFPIVSLTQMGTEALNAYLW